MDKDFCKGYIAVLKTCTFNNGKKPLSNTTCRIFVNRLAAALTKAVSEGLIDRNPFKLLDAKEKPQKNIFSCFRGLCYSDIKTLLWSEIRKAADGKILYLEHPQVKTKKIVTVPLSEEALKWMPKQQKDEEHVFHKLQITSTTVEVILSPLLSSLKFILTQIYIK